MSQLRATYFGLEVSRKKTPSLSSVHKFGENDSIAGTVEHIWSGGGDYTPPTEPRIHDFSSSSANDSGSVVSSGTVTRFESKNKIADSNADFVSDSVAVGDFVLNDSDIIFGVVTEVIDANTISMVGIDAPRYASSGVFVDVGFKLGSKYRVVSGSGTGSAFVVASGIGSDRLSKTEFVVLSGTSNTSTENSFLRMFRIKTFGASNNGDILATAQTDGTISARVEAGDNQTLMAIYTVPLDKIAYLQNWWASSSRNKAAAIDMQFMSGSLDGLGYVKQRRSLNATGSSEFSYTPEIPIVFAGGTDLWVIASASAETGVSSGFDLILESV